MTYKIIIINEFDSMNVGDQAIAAGIVNEIENICPTASISLVGLESARMMTKQTYHSTQRNGSPLNQGAHAATASKYPTKFRSKFGVFRAIVFVAWLVRYFFRTLSYRSAIRDADMVIIGGGGIIMNNKFHFPSAIFINTLWARIYNVPFGFTGISTGGEINAWMRMVLQPSFRSAKFIHVRDPGSASLIAAKFSVAVECFGDFAFSAAAREVKVKEPRGLVLNISSNATNLSIESYEAYIHFCTELIRRAARTTKLKIVTTGWPDDETVLKSVLRELEPEVRDLVEVCFAHSYEEYLDCVAESSLVVGSRLHASILAIAAGTQSAILNVGAKQSAFFAGIGLKADIVDFWGDAAIEKIMCRLDNTGPRHSFFASAASSQKKLCNESISIIISSIGTRFSGKN